MTPKPTSEHIQQMTDSERDKLFKIRCATKQGHSVSDEDMRFVEKMFDKNPREYKAMSGEVFAATKPVGAI